MDPITFAIDALATYRLTRLATADIISEPWRRSVVERVVDPAVLSPSGPEREPAQEVVDGLTDPPKLARLVTCRWCAGMWIAGGVVAARHLAPKVWAPAAQGLALSAVAVLVARAEAE